MGYDKKKYDTEYNKAHVKCKRIPFNDTNSEDCVLLSWLENRPNVTQYIKQLIREDMENYNDKD